MKTAPLVVLAAGCCFAQADHNDLYPMVRTLLREAQSAAAGIDFFEDHGSPRSWASSLYARAGYLDDAIRALGPKDDTYPIWRARVLYGDLAGVEKDIQAISDPDIKANRLVFLGDFLWRIGEPEQARTRLEAARQIAPKLLNEEHHKRLLTSIDQSLTYLASEPPVRISAKPHPPTLTPVRESALPLFPITQDGFRDRTAAEVEQRGKTNAEFMTNLYGRVAAGDREGLTRMVDATQDPFQRVLGLASLEHLMLQARLPDAAEQYAQQISAPDSECKLAKAEALSAAGAGWLEANNVSRGRSDFDAAVVIVRSVPDLTIGRISVALSIATAQGKGGMAAGAAESLKPAKELSLQMPLRPTAASGSPSKSSVVVHYRAEAYKKILLASIEIHDLGVAQEAANLWLQANRQADSEIVQAWLAANRADDAVVYARGIANAPQRAEALLVLAQALLDRAGAPNI